jgi:hypothetical protein
MAGENTLAYYDTATIASINFYNTVSSTNALAYFGEVSVTQKKKFYQHHLNADQVSDNFCA